MDEPAELLTEWKALAYDEIVKVIKSNEVKP